MLTGFPKKEDFMKLLTVSWQHYRAERQRREREWRRKRIIAGVFVGIVVLVYAGALLTEGVITFYKSQVPSVDSLTANSLSQETVFYDRHGTLLYRLIPGQRRVFVPLRNISPYIAYAVLAIEDHRFYGHGGVDPLGIARAFMSNVVHGQIVQGASTITQQLARFLYLDASQTVARKMKEAILSNELERRYSKNKILEMYLNAVPYGSDIYGVGAASREFFNKSAADLDIAQAAILAAIEKAPGRYFPFGGDRSALFNRQKLVIDAMARYGYITPAEAKSAKAEKITFSSPHDVLTAPHFVFKTLDTLRLTYGGQAVDRGMQVTTTLDAPLQEQVQQAVKDFVATRGPKFGADDAAAVVINAKDGNVLALVGSPDYTNPEFGAFDAALAERQPGSTLKPFIYGLAFERGLASPLSTVVDEPINFGGYRPRNFDNRYHGAMSARTALIYSYNIPAIKMLESVGVPSAVSLLNTCGLDVNADAGLTLVIGGSATTLYNLTAAYTVFANNGVCVPARTMLKVAGAQGQVLLDRTAIPPAFGAPVLSARAVRQVNSILTDSKYVYPEYRDIAANPAFRNVRIKTGTSDGPRDAWIMGYSDRLVVGVWIGNHDNSQMGNDVVALNVATPLWKAVFKAAYVRLPAL